MKNNRSYWKTLGIICLAILFYALVMNLNTVLATFGVLIQVLMPFLLGLAIAFIVNIPLRFFEKKVFRKLNRKKNWKKWKRPVSLTLSWLVILLFLALIFSLVLPRLIQTLEEFFVALPGYMDGLDHTVRGWIDHYNLPINAESININWSTVSTRVLDWLHSQSATITTVTLDILKGAVEVVANFIIALVFSIYVLASKESLAKLGKSMVYSHFKRERAKKILDVCSMSNKAFSGFISGQFTEGVVIGILCFIGMTVFKFPHALLVSCLIAITALVPVFGAIVGAFLGAFVILLVDPLKALLFLVFILVLQQVESNVIYPKIMGKSVGLPGIWVLVAVTVGGNLYGLPGMVLSVPTVSVLFALYERWLNKRLIERNISGKMLTLDNEDPIPPGQTHIDFDHPDQVGFDDTDGQDTHWDDKAWREWEQEVSKKETDEEDPENTDDTHGKSDSGKESDH